MGERLREALREARIRPSELARMLGVSSQRVSQIMTNGAKSVDVWEKIAAALNRPVSYFLQDASPNDVQTSSQPPGELAAEIAARVLEGMAAPAEPTPLRSGADQPGIRELLTDKDLCEKLGVTKWDEEQLRGGWPISGGIQTLDEAITLLKAVQAIRVRRGLG